MANELESLLVKLDADTAALRRALARADGDVLRFENSADRASRKVESRFDRMQSAVSGSLAGLGSAFAAAFGVGAALNAVKAVNDLSDAAEAASLGAQEFQALRVAASQAGVDVAEFDAALARFSLSMGEARARSGSFYEFLQKNLPGVAQQIQGTKTQGEALNVLSGALSRLTTNEERLVVAREALGKTSKELAGFLAQGTNATLRAADAARELGLALDDETLEKYKAAEKEINKLSLTISTTLQTALAGALPLIKNLNDAISEGSLRTNIEASDLSFLTDASLAKGARILKSELEGIQSAAAQATPDDSLFGEIKRGLFGTSAAQANNLRKSLANVQAELDKRRAAALTLIPEFQTEVVQAEVLKLQKQLPPFTTTLEFDAADALQALRQKAAEASGDTLGALNMQQDSEIERFRRLLAEKKIDEAEFNEARVLIYQSGSERIKQVYEEETRATAELGNSIKSVIEGSVGGSFDSLFRDGKFKASEFFQDILTGFARVATQALILKPILDSLFGSTGGGGSLGPLLASITPRASGGPMYPGQAYIAGERGPELIVPRSNMVARPGASMGGGGAVYNIDARGADISVAERIERALAAAEARRRDPVQAVAAHSRRYPARAA